jgi:hypothetical protein
MNEVVEAMAPSSGVFHAHVTPTMLRSATASTAKYTNAAEINRA